MKENMENIEILSELIEGGTVFEGHGYSLIKTTIDGKPSKRRLPITTRGVSELINKMNSLAPKPPVTKEFISMDSEQGKAIGLEEDRLAMIFDFTDEKYIRDLARHGRNTMWAVIIKGLKLEWRNSSGDKLEPDIEEKVRILKQNGITDEQAQQIYEDIIYLTRFQEGREDFLPASS